MVQSGEEELGMILESFDVRDCSTTIRLEVSSCIDVRHLSWKVSNFLP